MSKLDHGKGKITHNHTAALVRSKVFKHKIERDRSKYKRKPKHKNGVIDDPNQ